MNHSTSRKPRKDKQAPVCTYAFSTSELRSSVHDANQEQRGVGASGYPQPSDLLARALAVGARIHRRV